MSQIFRVKGNSMNPSYNDGDFVLTEQFPNYCIDDVVVLKLPKLGYVIKRIINIEKSGIILKGDNHKLHSSICDQVHSEEDIIGKVVSQSGPKFSFWQK